MVLRSGVHRCALETRDAGKNDAEGQSTNEEAARRGEIADEQSCAAANGTEQI